MTSAPMVLIDQVLSSSSNFLWFVAVAAALSIDDFGAFSVTSGLFAVALSAARTTSSERIAVGWTGEPIAALTTSLVVITVAMIAGTAGLALWLGSAGVLVWVAASPLILLQDRLRYIALQVRPRWAIVSDGVWLVCVLSSWVGALGDDTSTGWVWLSSAVGPALSLVVLYAACRRHVRWHADRDLEAVRSEVPYVIDGWLIAGAVFVVLAVLGAASSLADAAELRVLFLVFQPFFSVAYVGRWLVIRPGDRGKVRRWPQLFAAMAIVYALAAAGCLALAGSVWPSTDLLQVSATAFLLTAVGQVARAFHQGIADLARRSDGAGLLLSRGVFAVIAVLGALLLSARFGVEGVSLALMLGFIAGGAAARRFVVLAAV